MTDQERITLMLDSLAELRSQRDLIAANKQNAIDVVLTPDIQAQLVAIEEEFLPQLATADAKIGDLEAAVKTHVVQFGETVRGARLMACWTKPRVSWNTRALDGYAAAHPEIERFRSVGEPSVSIRQV